jgi:NAD(P)-dependent dehydrogenase (short-subunit alcohol dehydrogenase family)
MKNVVAITGYIRKEANVENVVKNTLENFSKIDVLVNKADIFPKGKSLHEISEKE